MQYQSSEAQDVVTISVSGELTYKDHSVFNEMLESLTGKQSNRVVCDLAGLEFIDSSGLGLLLLMKSQADKAGWELSLANADGQVAKMLKYTNINSQIPMQ